MGKAPRLETVPPLLEREREKEVLRAAVNRSLAGAGSLIIIEGPAGIGKTRLLQHVADIAGPKDALVRTARGGEMERDLPFGVVRQLFEPLIQRASHEDLKTWLTGAAASAVDVLAGSNHGSSNPSADSLAASSSLYWLAANLATERPLLLVIDDAQWADVSSLRFASFLARRVGDLSVVLVMGIRTGEPGESTELAALRLESELLEPRPLSATSVEELISVHTGARPSVDFREACITATAGNPFLILEILRELEPKGGHLDEQAAASLANLAPENVARTVLFRLGRFGPEAVGLAHAIAVLGQAPQLRHVALLSHLDEEITRRLCDDLRRAEILAPGLPIDFVHPLVRQAIYAELPDGERSASHREAAEILASTGAEPAEIAAHLLACEPNGDEWVVERLTEAGRAAMDDGAYDAAATYFERALKEPPADDVSLSLWLGKALFVADIFRAPSVLVDVVERSTDEGSRLEAEMVLSYAHIQTGNLVQAAATTAGIIERVRDVDREFWLGLEAQHHFLVFSSIGRDDELSGRIERAAENATGDTTGDIVVRQALGIDRYLQCAPRDEALALMLPFPQWPWMIGSIESPVPVATGLVLSWSGCWDQAIEVFEMVATERRKQRRILASANGHAFLSQAFRLGGRLHDAETEARTAREIASSVPGLSSYTWLSITALGAALLARGDVEGFKEVMGPIDLSLGPLEMPGNPFPLELRAYLHLEEGNLEAAAADFLSLGEKSERAGLSNPSYPTWRQEATEVLAALGRTREAEDVIAVAEERARAFGAPHTIASVLRARAMLEPRDRSIEILEDAARIFESSGPVNELARTLGVLGGALRRRSDRAAAREVLTRSIDLAEACGADGVGRRSRDELVAAGGTRKPRPVTGLGALTASELRIARLAAGGLTNKEIAERLFVTLRTVETHLTHAYEKLGIGGRPELARSLSVQI